MGSGRISADFRRLSGWVSKSDRWVGQVDGCVSGVGSSGGSGK